MDWFNVHFEPFAPNGNRDIWIDDFHSDWEKIARQLMLHNVETAMNRYSVGVEKLTKINTVLSFDKESGLVHVTTDSPASFHLDKSQRRYFSEDVGGLPYALGILAIANEYATHMRFGLKMIKEGSWT